MLESRAASRASRQAADKHTEESVKMQQ